MNEKAILLQHELLNRILAISTAKELETVIDEYNEKLDLKNNSTLLTIAADIKLIGSELIAYKKLLTDNISTKECYSLTVQEQTELTECERLITNNLFSYHFQPIVDTSTGEIYSYEALMRPKSDICPSPFHIMKYAEFTNRLNDIERLTFFNILEIIENQKSVFRGKRVFINSIPKAHLDDNDLQLINQLLQKHNDTVVVEMTEQSELDNAQLSKIKENYRNMNIKVAIDDYGTGYSNVQNLLRYMPDYVKIDRSLINEIDNSPKKRHFVREIIEFCHGNGIMALAEGVETADEMRTLILLGADLIQGYYTARPSADIISAIPLEIRREIDIYRQEREKGKELRVYYADNNERVLLDRLCREEYKRVVIGKNGKGGATLVSTPGIDTNIHVEIVDGFKGTLTIEGTELSNDLARPCINIGENCDVNIKVIGANKLNNGGIRVPESSRITLLGDGRLTIYIDGSGFYGIGNDAESRHGEIIFEDVGIFIENNAVTGICIGSGMGGIIRIMRGQFILNMTGVYSVGIGSLYADTELDMFACNVNVGISTFIGAVIGSLDGSTKIDIHNASTRLSISGDDIVGIGTVKGSFADISVMEANVNVSTSGERNSAIAALYGDTRFKLNKSSLNVDASGINSYAIGGLNNNITVNLNNSDTTIKLYTNIDYKEYCNRDNVKITGGRISVIINDKEIAI